MVKSVHIGSILMGLSNGSLVWIGVEMAVFPSLELEDKLQIQDKTRLAASKSFVSTGSPALTAMTVQPGADTTAVSVLSPTDQDLDWQFNVWNGDFDASNNKIDFKEGTSVLVATITPGTYTLAALVVEIQTQLNTVGSNTYTVVVSDDDRITISTTVAFDLLPYTGANRNNSFLVGLGYFSEDTDDNGFSGLKSYRGERVRYLPKRISLALDNGVDNETLTKTLKLYSIDGDALFSNDQDLISIKSDIMNWVKPGRNSFLNFHRRAQSDIIDFFRGKGVIDSYYNPLRVRDFVKPEDLKEWSTFLTLRLIFDDFSNATDDIFYSEARQFEAREMRLRNRYMRVDLDKDGVSDKGESINITSGRLFRG